MAHALLPVLARQVLGADEERFKELVRELARKALLKYWSYGRKERLESAYIVLGSITQRERVYDALADVPLCREVFGDGRGVVYVTVDTVYIYLGGRCLAKGTGLGAPATIEDAATLYSGVVETQPRRLYNLYKLFYKKLGTGARPLLELARKAEEEGDKEVAGILRRLYAILEASKDIVEEIEGADYSHVKVEVDESEVERKVEEAVELLREAKKAAKEGDAERLYNLVVKNKLILAPWHRITLDDITRYLEWEAVYAVKALLSFSPSQEELGRVLKEADIYDVFITAAEHFGLRVEF